MSDALIVEIAKYYSLMPWQGQIRRVNEIERLRVHHRVMFSDHTYLVVGSDPLNPNCVFVVFHDPAGNRLEGKNVLFQ